MKDDFDVARGILWGVVLSIVLWVIGVSVISWIWGE